MSMITTPSTATIPQAADPTSPAAITLTEIATRRAAWSDFQDRLVVQWRDRQARENGPYYLVTGTDDSGKALDAAVESYCRTAPEITETRHGDVAYCFRVRTVADLRHELSYSDEDAEWAYADVADVAEDPDILPDILEELDSLRVTWQPSEPPCRDGDGREHATHSWSNEEAAENCGGILTWSTCEHCGVQRTMDSSATALGPYDHPDDWIPYPALTISYYAADGETVMLRPVEAE